MISIPYLRASSLATSSRCRIRSRHSLEPSISRPWTTLPWGPAETWRIASAASSRPIAFRGQERRQLPQALQVVRSISMRPSTRWIEFDGQTSRHLPQDLQISGRMDAAGFVRTWIVCMGLAGNAESRSADPIFRSTSNACSVWFQIASTISRLRVGSPPPKIAISRIPLGFIGMTPVDSASDVSRGESDVLA